MCNIVGQSDGCCLLLVWCFCSSYSHLLAADTDLLNNVGGWVPHTWHILPC